MMQKHGLAAPETVACEVCGHHVPLHILIVREPPAGQDGRRTAVLELPSVDAAAGGKVTSVHNAVNLFETERIRDTSSHDSPHMLRVYGGMTFTFYAINTHNQIVTLQLVGNITEDMVSAGNIGLPITIAANRREQITVDQNFWACFLGFRASYVTAPTSGDLTVYGWAELVRA